MLNLSKRARLGLYVMVELARTPAAQRSNDELAQTLDVSQTHLAKVMQALARNGWIAGTRGAHGGYRVTFDAKKISMADVIQLFEGQPSFDACALAEHDSCSNAGECAIKRVVQEIETQAYYTMQSVTIEMLVQPNKGRRELLGLPAARG